VDPGPPQPLAAPLEHSHLPRRSRTCLGSSA
jgi:hypothetical protein